MAVEANRVCRFPQFRVVAAAVRVVTAEAGNAAPVHHALHEIVALHAVLMRRAVGKVREARFSQLVIFQLPEILQILPRVVAHGPVIIFPLHRIFERAPLRVARDASVIPAYVVHAARVQNILRRMMGDMLASRSVAAFASHVPFRDGLVVDVVIHRMAAVAGRAGGPLHVVRGIEWLPPVCFRRHQVGTPHLVHHIPLSAFRKIVAPDLCEVPLFSQTAVDQRYISPGELYERVRLRHVRNYGVGMFARIANHIRHGSLLPALINLRMAAFARLRSQVGRRGRQFRTPC